MSVWRCGIEGCGAGFESPEGLLEHQVHAHDRIDCAVCGESVPAGIVSIHHAFTEHTRADYLRAYEANSDDIRIRERIIEEFEAETDLQELLDSVGVERVSPAASD